MTCVLHNIQVQVTVGYLMTGSCFIFMSIAFYFQIRISFSKEELIKITHEDHLCH